VTDRQDVAVATRTEQRSDLSRERILDAAQTIIDLDGESGLTFRRLGSQLDADPTAAYRYFRSKDDLLLALADRLFGQALDALQPSADWKVELKNAAHTLRRALVSHPRLAILVSVRTTQGEQEARAIEHVLGTLLRAGLTMPDAVAVWRALADTTLAWSGFSAAYLALPDEVKAHDALAWTTTYRRLPADTYPHINAARPYIEADYDAFDFAIELLLDGVAARIPTPPQEIS
jgi:AcrR family transcriptional regulator